MVESGVKHYWPKPILITTQNLDQVDSNDCIVEPQHRISHFLDRDGSRISTQGGGGANLKKLRRAEGGANIFWVFCVKNHDFTPKNHIFSNFSGASPPPPWIRPCLNTNTNVTRRKNMIWWYMQQLSASEELEDTKRVIRSRNFKTDRQCNRHPITTKVMSSNPAHFEVYSIQHYVIVCQWLATGRWFSPGTLISSTNKADSHDITETVYEYEA